MNRKHHDRSGNWNEPDEQNLREFLATLTVLIAKYDARGDGVCR